MATAQMPNAPVKSLKDSDLRERLQELRQTDNWTNWLYFLRTYLYLAVVIGGAIGFDLYREAAGWSFWWNLPVGLVTIILVGAGQHQLSGLAHEASHHILFRNRYLNDLASDLLCLFPIFGSTHHYRLQHMAHHQFVNDPVRDPDISQLQTSGHWLPFPLSPREFVREIIKQLWIPNLLRFIFIRAKYNSTGTDKNPYMKKGWKPSKLPIRVGLLYIVTMIGLLTGLTWYGDPVLLAVVPALVWAGTMAFYLRLPESQYHQSRVHPVIPQRWMTVLRLSHITVVFSALAWITWYTGRWAAAYYFFYWLVPILTSFAFFMILRQLVQHGNADRGWITNTRMFFVSDFIRFSVFPMGQDYHLPHHMFATIPHYRLKKLHDVLMEYPEYAEQAVEVHGYFASPEHPKVHPTVLDVVGPEYAIDEFRGVHIDNSVLEDDEIDEKEAILREGEEEARRLAELNCSTRPAAQTKGQ
jgi:fatty acid desaturase